MKTIAILIAAVALTGCTLTVSPDGTRSYSPDSESIRIILEK